MTNLTLDQKQKVITEFNRRKKARENASQSSLARWAKDALRLDHVPHQSTMSRIIKNSQRLQNPTPTQKLSNKRDRAPAAPRLEIALIKWITTQNEKGVMLTGELIKMYAEKLQREANRHLPGDKQLCLTFSRGWLDRFKQRHSLSFRRVHGEALGADVDAINEQFPRILNIISTFAFDDVWNADEFGLFYRQPPNWTLSNTAVSGFKKEKTRLTFLACCNNDGTERLKLMVIGTAMKPRAFQKKSGQEHGFDYHANKKAWMTKELFFAWLNRFDQYVARKPGRKILLLLDNCSAHGKAEDLPPLHNIRVIFLPPNTTSKVQPLDAGIIAWVKRRYRRRLLFRVFENIESGKNSIYNVDIITAIRWTYDEWNACPSTVIRNCFQHCFKQGGLSAENERGQGESSETADQECLSSMQRDATESGVEFTTAGLRDLLNPAEEDDVNESVTIEELGKDIAVDDTSVPEVDADEQPDADSSESVDQQLHCIAVAKACLERMGTLSADTNLAFLNCQRALRLDKQSNMKQTTILDHFTSK